MKKKEYRNDKFSGQSKGKRGSHLDRLNVVPNPEVAGPEFYAKD